MTSRLRFELKSISKLSSALITALGATVKDENQGCIEEVVMLAKIHSASSLSAHAITTLSLAGSDTRLAGRVRRRPERAQAPMCSSERLEALDAELARRAREAGRLRFEIGRGLDLLERSGGDHVLGFSSIEAYALERCERAASWTQKARGLVRRLDKVPTLAEALISGSINWSMATVLASVTRTDDADFWLTEQHGGRCGR